MTKSNCVLPEEHRLPPAFPAGDSPAAQTPQARGARRIVLGLGGSATNDGGCGCAAALGVGFLDADGQSFVPVGDTLGRIARIDTAEAEALLRSVEITVMCDVTNPLYGPTGAAYVFAPQKGADAEKVKSLDAGLRHFGDVIRSQYGLDVSAMPGAGAAGGMGAGCVALLGGTIQSGIDAVLDVTGFDRQLEGADLVITGEGRIDSQSADGKVVSGVARRTRAKGVPLIAIAGGIADSAGAVYDIGVSAMFSTDRAALPVDMLGARSPGDYEATLSDIMSLIAIAERFAAASGYAVAATPYASGHAGYKDWFLQDFRRPGFTIEAGSGENPLPLSQFPDIWSDNLGILLGGMAAVL